MANAGRQAAAVLVVAMTLMTARDARADEEILTLVLRVENHAGISNEILRHAEEQATRIYAAIGVRTIWVHDATEDPGVRTRHLAVLLLSREMTERKIAADKVPDHELGRAAASAGHAYIFSHRIATVAAKNQRHYASVLGPVLAHEVGHMLLPAGSHSTTGLMRAKLDVRSKSPQQFTAAQGALIRRLLMAFDANETRIAEAANAAGEVR